MNTAEINEKYLALLNDIDFDWLELESARPNIFNILGAAHNELRHSNMLSWLMKAQESHGIGEDFVKRFLREVAQDEKSELSQFEVENLPYEEVEVRREWNHIDVLIIFPSQVIAIENKIWSKETGNQLIRYMKIVEDTFPNKKKSYVFLTPDGYISEHASDYYINISYQVVIDILSRILKIKSDEITTRVSVLLEDYLQILKRDIMSDDKTVELARKIYNNHKDLFDFVYNHKPDLSVSLRPYFENKVLESGWLLGSPNKGMVRFQTKEMKSLLPPNNKAYGWSFKEPLLFEIDYWWNNKPDNSDTRIYFKVTISPSENQDLKAVLKETIESIEGAKSPTGKKWHVYFPYQKKYDWNSVLEDEANIIDFIDQMWVKITSIVNKVNEKIIENQDKIKTALVNE